MTNSTKSASLLSQIAIGLNNECWDFTDFLLKHRFLQALEEGITRYPIQRSLRFAARRDLQSLFDELALNLDWTAQRLSSCSLILTTDDLFITASGGRKEDYCSCSFSIWSSSVAQAEQAKSRILDQVGDCLISEAMFSIDWHFMTAKGEICSASIEERANFVFYDKAYTEINNGIDPFIESYLNSEETVLVLQGPPGTGKTRLIRAILGAMSRKSGSTAQALYTGDMNALQSDEIFVEFITGWHDAFVVEDADHLLRPRAEGNENLHRFLAIADGVVRAQGRKIIFSTNLPHLDDLDDALIRPGRCFARLWVRPLSLSEAEALLRKLASDEMIFLKARNALRQSQQKEHSLADVYSSLRRALV